MSTHKIATSTLWQLGSQGITMLLGILSIKFTVLALSQSLVGNYQTVYAYLQIFGILADFGLYAVSVRELARSKNKALTFQTLFLLRAFITFIALALALTLAFLLPSFRGTPLPLGILLASLTPFFILLGGMFRSYFQVLYKMHLIFIAEILSKALPVLLMGGALLLGFEHEESSPLYFAFLGFGGIGALLFFGLCLWFARGLPEVCLGLPGWFTPQMRAEFRRIFLLAMPYGLAFLMTTIYRQSDVTLIALLRFDYDLQNAYYGTALRIAEIGFLVPTFLLNSTLPILSEKGESDERALFLGRLLLALLTLASISALFSFFWARPLMHLLTDDSYLSVSTHAGADTALQLLSFPIFLGFLITFSFYLLLLIHSWKLLLLSTSIAAAFSILFNTILIPQFGFLGAGMTSIAVHTLLAFGLTGLTIRKIAVYLPFARFARWFAFSIFLGFFLWLTAPLLSSITLTLIGGIFGLSITLLLLMALKILPSSFLAFKR